MTKDEFHEWLAYHVAAFPGLGEWLENRQDADKVQQHWWNAMRRFNSKHAFTATDEMVRGQIEEPPYGKHRGALATRCKILQKDSGTSGRPKMKIIDGEVAFTCTLCEDSGFLFVWTTTALERYHAAMNAGKKFDAYFRDVQSGRDWGRVRCLCDYGDSICQNVTQYDPDRHRLRIHHPDYALDSLLHPEQYRPVLH